MKLSKLYAEFTTSEKTASVVLLVCTAFSLILSNSIGNEYLHLFHYDIGNKSLEFWINDGLMTIFFLLVGLEIKRELFIGELSTFQKSLLPVIAAIGGMLVPALIHFSLNRGTDSQSGFGIPMATDIAFSLAILSLLGKRVPLSLKIVLTALAIIDDLGAIVIIALFYSKDFSTFYFGLGLGIFGFMLVLNRLRVNRIWVYLLIGMLIWLCIYKSGIHATISGVLLAFAIPFGKGEETTLSYKLQHQLHLPVSFIILPLFALANTAIPISSETIHQLSTFNSYGIILGLLIGKPLGIYLFSIIGISAGWCVIPKDIKRIHLLLIGLIAGIGFTMSIFITLLAFTDPELVQVSKLAVIIGSVLAGVLGYVGLRVVLKPSL